MSVNEQNFSAADLSIMMQASPAFQTLDSNQQQEMSASMAKVFGYLSNDPKAPARQLAPDFDSLRNRDQNQNLQQPPAPASQDPIQNSSGGAGAVDRAPGATAAMLGAIDFPTFVASLVQGTFQAIVDASIQQMEAYSNLLAETAKTVDNFMEDYVS